MIRLACEADLDDIENMVTDFVKGHPAKRHTRSRSALREAYFGDVPVANLLVAVNHGRIVGMGQWARIYDMFWSIYGANVEWLYVRPEYRGRGVVVAIVAEICAQCVVPAASFYMGAETRTSSASTNVLRLGAQHTSVTSQQKPSRYLRTWLV
jgi:GNAT superfamily N-acetyltransferase